MQTILGANGVIGRELSKRLPAYTQHIRQVSRNPRRVNTTDELFVANLLNEDETARAVAGSEVTYLVAGLPYDTKVWQRDWPVVMRNVINACKKHQSKLVFFDNVYAYGAVAAPMTERTLFNPTSKKGEVRAKMATMLLDEMKAGNLQALILRAADFYGPGAELSLTHQSVTLKLKAKKSAQWIGNPRCVHTFTYTPDAGATTALLGNTPSAYQQTWHALTSKEALTGEQYVRMACELAGQPYKLQAIQGLGVNLLSLFIPVLREFKEMMYQFDRDYFFDSSKFENAFHQTATTYREGIAATLK
jgi:nucleoside-diphosphate-sugar epimerase